MTRYGSGSMTSHANILQAVHIGEAQCWRLRDTIRYRNRH